MEISNIEDYKKILFTLLNIHHHLEAALQDGACNDEIRDFMVDNLNDMYDNFADLKTDIEKVIIAKKPFSYKSQLFSEKIIAFLYSNMVKFCRTTKVKGTVISKKFIGNISAILKDTYCIHHSHITGNILGYAHTFSNKKVRENYYKIPIIAHNLFRFDFLFLAKGIRASVWKTRDIVIGGKNPTDINFAYIGNQVQFIDTIKYFQQSLGALASSLTSSEKESIYRESEKYLLKDNIFSDRFQMLSQTEREWVLEYLSSGKGTLPYELIMNFDSLNISPKKDFFEIHQFYSNMKDSVLSKEKYENVKKFCNLLKLSNLVELNQIYDFQDMIILCEISELRADLFKEKFKFNPRKCNSASRFFGCVHRNKSVVSPYQQMQSMLEHLKKP